MLYQMSYKAGFIMSEMSADYVMQMSKSNSLQNFHSGKKN